MEEQYIFLYVFWTDATPSIKEFLLILSLHRMFCDTFLTALQNQVKIYKTKSTKPFQRNHLNLSMFFLHGYKYLTLCDDHSGCIFRVWLHALSICVIITA